MGGWLWMVACIAVGTGAGLVGFAAGDWISDRYGRRWGIAAGVLLLVVLAVSLVVFG